MQFPDDAATHPGGLRQIHLEEGDFRPVMAWTLRRFGA